MILIAVWLGAGVLFLLLKNLSSFRVSTTGDIQYYFCSVITGGSCGWLD